MFGLRSSARCVFTVSVAVFVVSHCCCCCCNVLGRIFACFIVSALSLGPRPRPLPRPPPCAMRVPMFLILYIDIWPPGCQKREPLPKVDCGSLSEARSVGGGSKRRRKRGLEGSHAHCHWLGLGRRRRRRRRWRQFCSWNMHDMCYTFCYAFVLMLKCSPLAAILPVLLSVAWGMSCFKCSGHHWNAL